MSDDKIKSHIEDYGWHCCYVFDLEGVKPEFSYTIGFEKTFNHPEIIVFGLDRNVAHQILSDIACDIADGVKLQTDIKLSNVIGGDYQVMFKEVDDNAFDKYLGQAVDFYNRQFKAWALLWPDKNKVLPIEEGCLATDQNEVLKIIK